MRADTRQPLGWQTTVSPYLRPHHLDLRENGLQLTLVLDGIDGTGWYPAFDVWYEETAHVQVPHWATVDNVSITERTNFSVHISIPRVQAVGPFIGGSVAVRELREEPHDVMLVLEGCDWSLDAGRPDSDAYESLSRAFVGPNDVGMAAGEAGWQLAGSGLLRARRENASHLTLTIPPLPAYRIASPETVRLTVPGPAMLQHHTGLYDLQPATDYSFVVLATPGSAILAARCCTRMRRHEHSRQL